MLCVPHMQVGYFEMADYKYGFRRALLLDPRQNCVKLMRSLLAAAEKTMVRYNHRHSHAF